MIPSDLTDLLSARIFVIESALGLIRQRQDVNTQGREVRGHLMDVLDLVRRDPGVDAAVDDLHRSVCAFIEAKPAESSVEARRLRLLDEAHTRFLDRLKAAGLRIPPVSGRDGLG
ncbi:hypothetical protein F6X53_24010 [Methylobacterium soli]|uniref:Uncharacterized protein n=1 Tax=Methylobacterium soli TaxID=553447 RepID=A0A6L3SVU4_9HYPH|nr:hypothetical protein F6X53_24010 [Methylobacterium soli]